jgi:predicted phosphodiesterase
MTLLIIADDESLGRNIPDCNADLLVSCGDLPDAVILEAAKRCHCREILAVKGNHDSSGPFPAPIRDLHLNTFEFRGLRFGVFAVPGNTNRAEIISSKTSKLSNSSLDSQA